MHPFHEAPPEATPPPPFLVSLREWTGELAIAAIIAIGGWLHSSIEGLHRDYDGLDKRLARVEYSVLGIVATATPEPAPVTSADRSPVIASPFCPIPSTRKEKNHDRKNGQ
jgi:hypothetical protein